MNSTDNDKDLEFEDILRESEEDSVRAMKEGESEWDRVFESVAYKIPKHKNKHIGVGEYKVSLTQPKHKDKQMLSRIGFFGRTLVDRYACEYQTALKVFMHKGDKPKWAVSGCVMLRDQGVCVVCGEKLSKTEIKQILPQELGGRWEEKNCVCVCKACAECWYPHRLFDRGLGRQDMLQALSVAIMERRAREYRGCKGLTERARQRLKDMAKELERRNRKVTNKAIELQLLSTRA